MPIDVDKEKVRCIDCINRKICPRNNKYKKEPCDRHIPDVQKEYNIRENQDN